MSNGSSSLRFCFFTPQAFWSAATRRRFVILRSGFLPLLAVLFAAGCQTPSPTLPGERWWLPIRHSCVTFCNVRALGAVGDGIADDTVPLQTALDSGRIVFLPAGTYRISWALTLRDDTIVCGDGPSLSRIVLTPGLPEFQDPRRPRAVLETRNSTATAAQLSGIGLVIGPGNPGAIGVE